MNPYLHISDIAHMLRCERMAWISHDSREPLVPFANSPVSLASLYIPWMHLEDLPVGKTGDTAEHSLDMLSGAEGALNLRLEYQGVRTKIPILLQIPDHSKNPESEVENLCGIPLENRNYLAVYPHLSASVKESELELMKLNQMLAEKLGIHITAHEALYLNADYRHAGSLEADKLLCRSDHLFKKTGTPFSKSIDEQLSGLDLNLDELIAQAKEVLYGSLPAPRKHKLCSSPRKCAQYEECFGESNLPDDSIAFLFACHKRRQLEEHSIQSMNQIRAKDLDGFPLQYAQAMAAKNGGVFMDHKAVKAWLDQLVYPLIYLDFEWDTFAIPPYEGMKPYDVLCFQSSMHVEEQDGSIRHYNFFEGGDCRRHFIESLLSSIPSEGSILVYNMEGAEKLRLTQLAEQFPEYHDQLEQVWNRMTDLSVIFENGAYYDLRQRGHFSLKSVLPVFDDSQGYHALQVQDGLQAIQAYRQYERSSLPEERKQLADEISAYCAMDTQAEITILHGLQSLCEKEN